jgi:hypothetical protein
MIVGDTIGVCDEDELIFLNDNFSDIMNFSWIGHRNNKESIISRKLCPSVLIVTD